MFCILVSIAKKLHKHFPVNSIWFWSPSYSNFILSQDPVQCLEFKAEELVRSRLSAKEVTRVFWLEGGCIESDGMCDEGGREGTCELRYTASLHWELDGWRSRGSCEIQGVCFDAPPWRSDCSKRELLATWAGCRATHAERGVWAGERAGLRLRSEQILLFEKKEKKSQ